MSLHLQSRQNLRGVAAMLVAVGSLSIMDAFLKILAPHYSSFQVASLRALCSLPFAIAWVGFRGGFGQLVRVRVALHIARAILGIVALSTFAFGVRHLPLSEAYAVFFVAPLLITTLAVLLLGERVDAQRWVAIAVGFAGVLIVLRPAGTGAVSIYGIAVFVTAVCYALSAITVRILGRTDSTESMMFWLMLLVGVGAGLLALPQWRAIQPEHWAVLAGLAVSGSLGQLAITEAFRIGESSVIAPFEYTALAWGLGLDWFIWRTMPAPITFVGAGVIIVSGLYLVRRERELARAAALNPPK